MESELISLSLDKCFLKGDASFSSYVKSATSALDKLLSPEYEPYTGWLTFPDDVQHHQLDDITSFTESFAQKYDTIIVVGIGGSYLGTKALLAALGSSFNKSSAYPEIIFAGHHLNGEYVEELLEYIATRSVAIVVVSKSGTTLEPSLVFRILQNALEEKYGYNEACKRIVAITSHNGGSLRQIACNENYKTFAIPQTVGGRFSVLTAVGLVPLALAGFDITALIQGAKAMQNMLLNSADYNKNPAILYAAARQKLYCEHGKKIELLATFDPKLESLGDWWVQLFSESEGKDKKGLFVSSVAYTTDLHAVGQWVQDGERNVFETFLTIKNNPSKLQVPLRSNNCDSLNYLAGRTMQQVNSIAIEGTKEAHFNGGVPIISISLPTRDAFSLGAAIYFFELAVALSGIMMGVNPFNQPGVEAYKREVVARLAQFKTSST